MHYVIVVTQAQVLLRPSGFGHTYQAKQECLHVLQLIIYYASSTIETANLTSIFLYVYIVTD